MAVRHRRIGGVAVIVAVTLGVIHRYFEVVFGENTNAALYGWHCGLSLCVIALCYLAINPPTKRLRGYLRALYPVTIAHLASDVFNRGDLSVLDHIAVGISILIIIRTFIYSKRHGK